MTLEQMQSKAESLQVWVDDYIAQRGNRSSAVYTAKLCALYDLLDQIRRKSKKG
jgi:hypothetical protein